MSVREIAAAFSEEQIAEMYDRISSVKFENKVSLHERYFKRINELSYILMQKHSASKSVKLNKSALITRYV